MDGDREMITSQEMKRCINKLKDGKDITKRDISKIVSFCKLRKTKIDPDLMQTYEEWFKAVADRLPEFGNYAYTVPVCSFLMRKFDLGVMKTISECLDKMSLLDKPVCVEVANIPVADWIATGRGRPTSVLNLEFAGGLRSSFIYERALGMVPLLEEDFEEKYGSPEYDLGGICFGINIQTLYVQSILSVACRMKMPIVRIITENTSMQKRQDVVLVDPSGRKNLENMLSLTPDEVFDQVKGILGENASAVKKLKGTVMRVTVPNPRQIFDEAGEIVAHYSFLKEKRKTAEDDEWLEVIR